MIIDKPVQLLNYRSPPTDAERASSPLREDVRRETSIIFAATLLLNVSNVVMVALFPGRVAGNYFVPGGLLANGLIIIVALLQIPKVSRTVPKLLLLSYITVSLAIPVMGGIAALVAMFFVL